MDAEMDTDDGLDDNCAICGQRGLLLACDGMMSSDGVYFDDFCKCIQKLLDAKADKGKLSRKQKLQLTTVYEKAHNLRGELYAKRGEKK